MLYISCVSSVRCLPLGHGTCAFVLLVGLAGNALMQGHRVFLSMSWTQTHAGAQQAQGAWIDPAIVWEKRGTMKGGILQTSFQTNKKD